MHILQHSIMTVNVGWDMWFTFEVIFNISCVHSFFGVL